MKTVIPYFLVLLAAVLWGTTGTATTLLPDSAQPLTIAAARSAVGGFSLLLVMILMKKINFRTWPWKATVVAAICMAIFQPLFFTSVRLTGIAIGTVVAIGSAPVFSGLIEWLFLKMRPSRSWAMATAMSVIGCSLLFLNKDALTVNPIGVTFSLIAGLVFAIYTIVTKAVLTKVEAIPAVAMTFSMSALMLMPFILSFDNTWIVDPSSISIVLYLGLLTTSVAYILYLKGLHKVPSSSAVTLSLGEPLTAAVLSVFWVGEVLSPVSWVGILLLLGGILVLTFSGRKRSK
ncbi:EamA family transporter [Paenisporosarcina indica]|uniref:EamA family transporter n=1 Tax=Paenisporosarcina indica TaxID=650093 RepID=UPI00094FC46B|nr:EamA family transporter [Paenisporosarcina indica]